MVHIFAGREFMFVKKFAATAAALSLSASMAMAQGHGHGHDKDKHDHDRDEHRERVEERHSYREHDRELHEWYRGHYDHLPPGLAKKDRLPPGLERQLVVRGTLPPGLRGYMRPCPVEVVQYLPPAPVGYMHTVIGGNIVLVNKSNFLVVDVFHFEL
jgi:Ni/Co efflux regulator RcnB